MCAACFLAGDASKAPVDGLPREADVGVLYFRDELAAGEHGCAGLPLEPFDGVDDGIPAAWTTVGELRLQGWDGDGGSVDGVMAVRIV